MQLRRSAAITATALVAAGAFTAIAGALPALQSSGTTQLGMVNKSDGAPQSTASVAWVPLLEAVGTPLGIPVTVPVGKRVLVNARFTAESMCYGPAGAMCRARIVAVGPAAVPVELQPATGTDYHFDTAFPAPTGNIDKEGHAMERSIVLSAAGVHTVRVHFAVNNAAALFTLDEWHLAVETTVVP